MRFRDAFERLHIGRKAIRKSQTGKYGEYYRKKDGISIREADDQPLGICMVGGRQDEAHNA